MSVWPSHFLDVKGVLNEETQKIPPTLKSLILRTVLAEHKANRTSSVALKSLEYSRKVARRPERHVGL